MVTLINMVAISMMSAKFATLAFLKLKILAHAIPSAAQLPRVWTIIIIISLFHFG